MCACLRQVSSLLTLKTASNKATPSKYRHFLNFQHQTIYLFALFHTRITITIPTNPMFQFVCRLCCLCDAFWNVPCFIPFLFAFRSEVPTKTFCLCSLRLPSLFLISVMHCCCFNRCQSSTNRSVSVFHFRRFCRYFTVIFLLFIVYCYFLYILCFYICCNFFFLLSFTF